MNFTQRIIASQTKYKYKDLKIGTVVTIEITDRLGNKEYPRVRVDENLGTMRSLSGVSVNRYRYTDKVGLDEYFDSSQIKKVYPEGTKL